MLKCRYHTFLVLSNFVGILYFVPNILIGIVRVNHVFVSTRSILLETSIFSHFLQLQNIFPIFHKSIKQVSHVKVPNLMAMHM